MPSVISAVWSVAYLYTKRVYLPEWIVYSRYIAEVYISESDISRSHVGPHFFLHMAAKSAYFFVKLDRIRGRQFLAKSAHLGSLWSCSPETIFAKSTPAYPCYQLTMTPICDRQLGTSHWAPHTGRQRNMACLQPIKQKFCKYYIYIDIGPMLRSAISQRSQNWGPDGFLTSPTCSHLPLRLWSLDMMSENFAHGEINERSFSNPQPRSRRTLY